jgi:hypothetical protein
VAFAVVEGESLPSYNDIRDQVQRAPIDRHGP